MLPLLFMLSLTTGFYNKKAQTINPEDNVNINCHAAVLIDQESHRILYEKNVSLPIAMASTTKIMTATLAIERSNLFDKVKISQRAAHIHGSTVGFKAGEVVTLEELLYALMLKSGNDAAIAIAEHISGTVEGFANLMSSRAMELGALQTRFSSPHGLDHQEHYSTAFDMAIITAHAMKNKEFCKIVSTKACSAGTTGAFTRSYHNINKFLYQFPYADGVKTGYTGNAGKCLVASASRGSERLIAVLLNSGSRFHDAEKLMNFGFDCFKPEKIIAKGKQCDVTVLDGRKSKKYPCILRTDVELPVKKDNPPKLYTRLFVPSVIYNKPDSNVPVGNLAVYENGTEISRYPLYLE